MLTGNQKERYTWLVFLIGGILLWKVIIPTQVHTNQNSSSFGPDLFPNILAIIIIIISGISFIATFIKKGKRYENEGRSKKNGKASAGIIVFAIMVGYTYVVEIIHFIPASIVSMFLIMWLLSVRKWYL